MNTAETCYHQLEVYTAHVCWCCKILIGSQRRVSDILNDPSLAYVTLENARAWPWKPGLRLAEAQIDTVTIIKRNIVFVIEDAHAIRATPNLSRVQKKSQTVTIHAPPFSMMGNVYFAREAHWASILNVVQGEFIPMTDTTIWRMDDNTILPVQSGFVAVNRAWIETLYPVLPEAAAEPVASPVSKQAIPVG